MASVGMLLTVSRKVLQSKSQRTEQLDLIALGLRPGVAVGERREERECGDRQGEEGDSASPVDDRVLLDAKVGNSRGGEIEHLAEGQDSKIQGREIMVEEELALHEIEREVVEGPAEDGGADFVVEPLEGGAAVVIAAALPAGARRCP